MQETALRTSNKGNKGTPWNLLGTTHCLFSAPAFMNINLCFFCESSKPDRAVLMITDRIITFSKEGLRYALPVFFFPKRFLGKRLFEKKQEEDGDSRGRGTMCSSDDGSRIKGLNRLQLKLRGNLFINLLIPLFVFQGNLWPGF